MSKTIQVPVQMPLTLPDNWQDCTTAQQLAYWILAEFQEFEQGQATKEDISELSNAINQLSKVVDTKVTKNTTVALGRYAYGINNTKSGGIVDTVFAIDPEIDVPQAGNIPVRVDDGNITVPDVPKNTGSATSRKYVDENDKEISDACHANTVAIGNINTNITNLDTRVTTAENDITTAETNITTLQTKTTKNESDIASVDARVSNVDKRCDTLNQDIINVSGRVTSLNTNVTTINGEITEIQTDIGELQSDVANLPKWVTNSGNVVSLSSMFQIVTAVNDKVTVSDNLFTSDGYSIFVMVKGLTKDIANGQIFEKTGVNISYDTNVREIDSVAVTQNPVFLINCFTKSTNKFLNVSLLSAFV